MSPLITKAQSLKFESKTHEAQLEDQKAKKSSRMPSRRRKTTKANKRHEKRQNDKEELRKAQKSKKRTKPKQKLKINTPLKSTPPNTLNACSPP
jgi:hypothetical protein